jgi:hypothetical protein
MSRLLFLSITSVAAAVLVGGCGDDACGPMGASDVGLVAGSADVTLTFGHLSALAGNDCPDQTQSEVISQSLEGTQVDGTGLITICIPRPDLLPMGNRTLGTSTSMADVRLFDVSGTFNNCTFTIDSSRPPAGMASGKGVCGNGDDPAGFQLTIDGALNLKRDCGGTMDTIAVTLQGTIAVAHRGT